MSDQLLTDAPIPVDSQIASVNREITLRRRVYPKWVADGRMSQRKADDEIAAMTAVVASLEEIRRLRASLAGKNALVDAVSKLQCQRGVLVDLLGDCLRVIQTIDGDCADEDAQLRSLRNRISMVISETARSNRNDEFKLAL